MFKRSFSSVFLFILPILVALSLAGCTDRDAHGETASSASPEAKHEDHAGNDHGPEKGLAEHGEKGGQEDPAWSTHGDHGHAEGSDLDRPAPELFAARCEHNVPTHQCAECRYEVGVVQVGKDLIEGGLVHVDHAAPRKLDAPITLTGEIRFDERRVARASPAVPGTIRKVHVDLGQAVKAGQPLFEMDSAELAGTQGESLEAQSALRLAQRDYARQQELWEANVTSEKEFQAAKEAFEAARAKSEAASGKLARLGASGGASGRYIVRAPIDGTILELRAALGEFAETGKDVMLVGDVSTVWVWIDLYEKHLEDVTTAWSTGTLLATVKVDAYPNETFQGTVDFVGATMEESSRTIKARLSLTNHGGRLRPGMFAKVHLHPQGEREVLALPATAVQSDEGRDFVFVRHEGDYFLRRPVVKGLAQGDLVEVRDGLKPGQEFVTVGAFLLKSDVLRSKMGAGCTD